MKSQMGFGLNKNYFIKVIASLIVLHLSLQAQTEKWDYLDPFNSGQVISGSGNEIIVGKFYGGALVFNKLSLNNTYYKRFYTPLASNIVRNVEIDKFGNKWFACSNITTNDERTGICKFNGSDWSVYDSSNSPVPHEDLKYMHIDKAGNLWVGTMNKGLLKFDGNVWTVYDTSNSPIPSNHIRNIISDSTGILWFIAAVAQNKDKLVSFDGITFTVFDPNIYNYPDFFIFDIAIDNNNIKWLYTLNQLCRFNDTTFTYFNSGINIFHFTDLGVDYSGNKYICNLDTGLVVFDQNENWHVINISDTEYYNQTLGIYTDENDIRWILTRNGLTKLENNITTNYPLCNAPILDLRVDDFVKDSENNEWFATFSLIKYDGQNWTEYNSSNSPIPPYTAIISLDTDENHNLWIATQLEGILKLRDTSWTLYNMGNYKLPSNFIRKIKTDHFNILWAVCDTGIIKIDNDQITVFNDDNSPFSGNNFHTVAVDKNNNKWFGGETSGLVKFDDLTWTIYDVNNSGLISNTIQDITADKLGNIWLTSGESVQVFDGTNWNLYKPSDYGSPNDRVNALRGDEIGNVWASLFFNGFAKIDPQRNWTIFNNINSGLLGINQIVHSIRFDDNGFKWLCTNDGGVTIYKGDLTGINVKSPKVIPNYFQLYQNYPNPFNPSTTIEFSLPENVKNVKLSIYNVLGEKITELINGTMPAGKYEYKWNAKNFASGMYIYELRTEKFNSVKKMLLLK